MPFCGSGLVPPVVAADLVGYARFAVIAVILMAITFGRLRTRLFGAASRKGPNAPPSSCPGLGACTA